MRLFGKTKNDQFTLENRLEYISNKMADASMYNSKTGNELRHDLLISTLIETSNKLPRKERLLVQKIVNQAKLAED